METRSKQDTNLDIDRIFKTYFTQYQHDTIYNGFGNIVNHFYIIGTEVIAYTDQQSCLNLGF